MRGRVHESLLFPSLGYVTEPCVMEGVTLDAAKKVTDPWGESHALLYKLDWKLIEEKKRARFQRFLDNYEKTYKMPAPKVEFINSLPDVAFEELGEARFALSENYHSEIRRQANAADLEWGQPYLFDTMVRGMLLEPARSHAEVAFRMLFDCLAEPSGALVKPRGVWSYALMTATMVGMWTRQTGGYWIFQLIEDLQKRIDESTTHAASGKKSEFDADSAEDREYARLLCVALHDHYRLIAKEQNLICEAATKGTENLKAMMAAEA